MSPHHGKVRGLGEIALRVHDLNEMQAFYQNVIGLQLMQRFDHAAFFRIAEGVAGHTQILALFDRSDELDYRAPDTTQTTVDHIAFGIALADYESERQRLIALGYEVDLAEHAWVHWRSIFLHDPEGNRVELVCYDPAVG